MKDNKKLLIVLFVVSFAIYNVLIFLLPFTKDVVFYTCYGFTMIAFLAQAIIIYYNTKSGTNLHDLFLGLPLMVIGVIYFIIQFVLGFIINIIPFDGVKYPILIQLLLLFVFGFFAITAIMGKNKISSRGKAVEEKVRTLSFMENDVLLLKNKTSDEETIARLIKLADNIKYSDPMSDDSLREIEDNMKIKVGILKECIDEKEKVLKLCDEIDELILERNSKCKILK